MVQNEGQVWTEIGKQNKTKQKQPKKNTHTHTRKTKCELMVRKEKTKDDFYACAIAGVETGAVVMEARHCSGTADAFFGAGM